MHQRLSIVILICFSSLFTLHAQQYDKHWIVGWNGIKQPTGWSNISFGISHFTFDDNDSLTMNIDSFNMKFNNCNVTISDSTGKLLFYTNGVTIRNMHNEVFEYGDSLGWGWYMRDVRPAELAVGRYFPMTALCLPTDSYTRFNYYYLYIDSVPWHLYNATKLLMASIDVKNEKLVFKDSVVFESQVASITATKTADSKGWWLMLPEYETNCFKQVLIDSLENIAISNKCNGVFIPTGDLVVRSLFSNDGTKYISASNSWDSTQASGIQVFDFDRCNGELTLLEAFRPQIMVDSSWVPWGIATSPNSQYLYLMCSQVILQFDLYANNIANSMVLVANASGKNVPFPSDFYQAQLGPDGKIYINSGSTNAAVSIIQNPDVGGIGCNVVQDVPIPSIISGLVYYPNYRLGPVECGVGILEKEEINVGINTYPNPATNNIQIEYDGIYWEQYSTIKLSMYDINGKVLYSNVLPMYSMLHQVDISGWVDGFYLYEIRGDDKPLASGKFLKESSTDK